MKFASSFLLLSFLLFLGPFSGHGQAQHRVEHLAGYEGPGFRLGAVVGYVVVPTSTSSGREHLILPSFGLDLEYWFSHRLGIGLHNDLELMVFEVETEKDVFVERDFPMLVTIDMLWKPWRGLVIYGGPGIEFEPSEHYYVGRLGAEYEIPIGKHWDIFPTMFYDYRRGAYNTFSIGLGIGKRL